MYVQMTDFTKRHKINPLIQTALAEWEDVMPMLGAMLNTGPTVEFSGRYALLTPAFSVARYV